MAVPVYPLDLPTTPGIRRVTWQIKRATPVSESPFTGAQQALEFDYALWTASVELPPMKREDAAAWQAFFMQIRGRRGTFLLGDPDAKESRGAVTGDGTMAEDASVGDLVIKIGIASGNVAGAIKTGDYIQINEGARARLHMAMSDADTDTSGVAEVNIEPALKEDVSVADTVILQGAKGVFRLDEATQGWDADLNSLYGFSFSCKEAT